MHRDVRISLLLLLVLAVSGLAQEPDAGELPTFGVSVDLVNILCSVRDGKGRLISDLGQDEFQITEDGADQEIRYFSRETDLPLTIGLLVDVSRSQESLIEVEKDAGYRFFSEVLRDGDLAFLMSFGADVELLQDLTGSTNLLRNGLDELRLNAAVGGILPSPVPQQHQTGTALYDAVFLAADDRMRNEVGRKAMVVITDGVDVGSKVNKQRAIELAQKADAIIYSIYYSDPRYRMQGSGWGDLRQMSNETGGRAFRVTRKDTLESIFAQIQEEMRNQYSIAYAPTNSEKDGSYRRVKVRTTRRGLNVQAREGYYAISEP